MEELKEHYQPRRSGRRQGKEVPEQRPAVGSCAPYANAAISGSRTYRSVYEILRKGSEEAERTAAQTLKEVRACDEDQLLRRCGADRAASQEVHGKVSTCKSQCAPNVGAHFCIAQSAELCYNINYDVRKWWNGRHMGLKILCPFGRAGSSPAFRIRQKVRNIGISGLFACFGVLVDNLRFCSRYTSVTHQDFRAKK